MRTFLLYAGAVGGLCFLAPVVNSQSVGAADSPRKVAELLDCFVQNRFGQADGRLGVSRMVTLQGHERVRLFPETTFEKELMGRIKAGRRPYAVSFLHVDRPPAISKETVRSYPQYTAARRASSKPYLLPLGMDLMTARPKPPRRPMSEKLARTLYAAMMRRMEKVRRDQEPIAAKAAAGLPRLRRGDPVNLTSGEWEVALRPVRAKAACLGCHTRSKAGDTLGVMVYAVSRTVVSGRNGSEMSMNGG